MTAAATAASAATGLWLLDPTRASVSFSGRASRLAPTFRASFGSVSGSVEVQGVATLQVDVDLTSITTGNRSWDELLRTIDPFEATRCPVATYRGRADVVVGDLASVSGHLELRGVEQPVPLLAQVTCRGDELLISATGTVDRHAFGVRCDLPGVGRLVPSLMSLEIQVTAIPAGRVPRQR